jgi:hypothetical protein
MITDGVASPESSYGRAEDLTEQATADHDYELDEGWLEEQLLDSPDTEVQTSESPAEAPVSPGTSHLFCRLLATYFAVYLLFYFCLVAEPSTSAGPPETVDVPVSTPVSPISGDEATSRVSSLFISSLIVMDCLTCLFCCRCHVGGRETRVGRVGGLTSGHFL